MLDEIFAQMKSAIGDAKKTAATRLARWNQDPYALGMRDAAEELDAVVTLLMQDAETVTTAEYAQLHGVTPQTVTSWIRRKELEATGDRDTGYRIRRAAVRKPRTNSHLAIAS